MRAHTPESTSIKLIPVFVYLAWGDSFHRLRVFRRQFTWLRNLFHDATNVLLILHDQHVERGRQWRHGGGKPEKTVTRGTCIQQFIAVRGSWNPLWGQLKTFLGCFPKFQGINHKPSISIWSPLFAPAIVNIQDGGSGKLRLLSVSHLKRFF
jgi:hypothetical protein